MPRISAPVQLARALDRLGIAVVDWLVLCLNDETVMKGRERAAWEVIKKILEPSQKMLREGLRRESIRRFNEEARRCPVIMRLRPGKEFEEQELVSDNPLGLALTALWEAIDSEGLPRLRRCAECDQWFHDRTTNLGAKYCGRRCSNRVMVREWRQRQREKARKPARQAKGRRTAARRRSGARRVVAGAAGETSETALGG
jgi:hypothetical protein